MIDPQIQAPPLSLSLALCLSLSLAGLWRVSGFRFLALSVSSALMTRASVRVAVDTCRFLLGAGNITPGGQQVDP